jgi:YfiH family protein
MSTNLSWPSQNSNGKFLEHKEKGRIVLKASTFDVFRWLRHGFSTRPNGRSVFPENTFNLGFTKFDSRDAVEANRKEFFASLGMKGCDIIRLRQTHSDRVATIHSSGQSNCIVEADAVVTTFPGVALTVLTADCLPILVVDPISRALAAIHAGWRGTSARITSKAIETLQHDAGASIDSLWVALGPSIRSCCYEVGEEVLNAFKSRNPQAERYFFVMDPQRIEEACSNGEGSSVPEAKYCLDLVAANCEQLLEAGVVAPHILVSPDCTSCRHDLYFSHRRDNGRTGRMMAAIARMD